MSLVSPPSAKTNMSTLVQHMVIAAASPGDDTSRRSIRLTGEDGNTTVLTAVEQRTAISWMEAVEMMLGNTSKGRRLFGRVSLKIFLDVILFPVIVFCIWSMKWSSLCSKSQQNFYIVSLMKNYDMYTEHQVERLGS